MWTRSACLGLMMAFSLGCTSGVKLDGETCDACCSGDDGYISLFDGRTLDGWRNWNSPSISTGWAVQDGTLARVADGAGNIITERQFSSFDLTFEWKVARGANSGVFYHVSEADDKGLITSPEYQILDNANHPDGGNPKTTAASNYGLYAPVRDVTRPVGQWNEGRIVVRGDDVEHWLNGVKVVQYTLGSEQWTQIVRGSKFAQWPAYGTRRKGHIALQDHGDPVWYRNIRIKELPGS
jgi:hypothetical protein